jgi:hypothetical protein
MGEGDSKQIEAPAPDFDLEIKLSTTAAEHEEEIERLLTSLPERFPSHGAENVKLHVEFIKVLHSRLFRASQTLVHEGLPTSIDELNKVLPAWDAFLLLKDLLKLHLAQDAISTLPGATDRARQLLELAFESRLSPVAQAYLAWVGRCFTWGYEAECLILCRSVLEQVLEETITDRDVFDAYTWNPDCFPAQRGEELRHDGALVINISDRIHAAQALGRLSGADANVAKTIRDRGNRALHEVPPSSVDVLGTMRTLLGIINALTQ